MDMEQIKWLLCIQRFRGATVTTMVISTMLAITVTGGVLQRTQQQMHTTGT